MRQTDKRTHNIMIYRSASQKTIEASWFLPGSQKGLKMEIVFKRRLVNDLLTTYLPSFLLLLLSYATTFFKPIYFEAAVTVNLSILLVITTLFVRRGNRTTENPSSLLWNCLVWWESFLLLPMCGWWIFGSYLVNSTLSFRDKCFYKKIKCFCRVQTLSYFCLRLFCWPLLRCMSLKNIQTVMASEDLHQSLTRKQKKILWFDIWQ